MAGINYRKHSQCLKEFERLNESAAKRGKKYPRGSWPLSANKCHPLPTPHCGGGGPRVVNKRVPPRQGDMERSSHLTPAPSQEQGSPKAFFTSPPKAPLPNPPAKGTPAKLPTASLAKGKGQIPRASTEAAIHRNCASKFESLSVQRLNSSSAS